MGLGEFFDGVVREVGRSDAGTLLRASDKSIDNLFRGPESRCRKRFQQSYAASQQNSSSNNSDISGLASLAILGGVALFGALFCDGKNDNKATNAK